MIRMKSPDSLLVIAFLLTIAGCGKVGQAPASIPAAYAYAPVTLAFSCPADGSQAASFHFPRDVDVGDPSGALEECVAGGKIARDLQPAGMRLAGDERLALWDVILRFTPDDAEKIHRLTVGAQGKRLVVIVHKKVVFAAYVNDVFIGNDLSMSATSRADSAHLGAKFLVKK
jgi:predicted small lipoprotein YifL